MPMPKFRAWHKEYKIMAQVRDICNLGRHGSIPWVIVYKDGEKIKDARNKWYKHEIELIQWTGLQDLELADIYEGDILDCCPHVQDRLNQRLYYIKRDIQNGQFNLRILDDPYKDMLSCYRFCDPVARGSKILGNIYETQGLLHYE